MARRPRIDRAAEREVPVILSRADWREWSVPRFTRRIARRHPELQSQIRWPDVLTICEREGVLIRLERLSHHARLLRFGTDVYIQLNRRLDQKARTVFAMHELCHFWRDDPGEPCYYADDYSQHPREEFADIFAWYVTTPDRPTLRDWE